MHNFVFYDIVDITSISLTTTQEIYSKSEHIYREFQLTIPEFH